MSPNTQDVIQDFLGCRRLAIVGVSRQPGDFSRALFREFAKRNYDVVPVNPNADEIEGRKCFHSLLDVQPPVEGALMMTDPAHTESAMSECSGAGIRRVWMFRGADQGSVSESAIAYGKRQGMQMVIGECQFMFLPKSGAVHSVHRFFRRITGGLPH